MSICQDFLDVFAAFARMAVNNWPTMPSILVGPQDVLYFTPIVLFVKKKASSSGESEQFYRHIQFVMFFCCVNPPKRLPASKRPGYSPGP